jgi:hypothetical protein
VAITEQAEPEPVVVLPPADPAARTTAARAHDLVMRVVARLDRFKTRAPKVIAVLRIIYLPIAIGLVAYIGWRAGRKIDFSTVRVWALVLAYLAALVWWIALALGWSTLITERFHRAQFDAWCKTQVTRYLPGGIWAPLTRATTVQGRIRDKATAVVAENAIVACAALGIGALWACVHQPIYLLLVVMLAVPTFGARWLEQRSNVTRTGIVRTTGLYSAGYVFYGASALLTQIAVSGVRHPTYPLYVAGAACIAWVVGLVVVFAPGGVGVREVVYIWLLGGLYPHAELQAAAVVARLVTVLAELTVLSVISVRFTGKSQAAVT